MYTKEDLEEYKQKVRDLSPSQQKAVQEKMDKFEKAFTNLIERGIGPESQEAQELLKQHHHWIAQFWKKTPPKEIYIALAKLYQTHPDFPRFFAHFHPNLSEYLAKGMKIFAQNLPNS